MSELEDNARLHIHSLSGAGWTYNAIADAAGVARSTLFEFRKGRAGAGVAARVLAVQPQHIGKVREANDWVPRIGTVRRIQALLVMGWTHQELSQRLGYKSDRATSMLLANHGLWVFRDTHDRVAHLYRELSHRRGPSHRGRLMALARGYVGPADWDDIDLDETPEIAA
ncbi:hypothetical protein GCM10028801_30260 [Nocardioides maradonensis]